MGYFVFFQRENVKPCQVLSPVEVPDRNRKKSSLKIYLQKSSVKLLQLQGFTIKGLIP